MIEWVIELVGRITMSILGTTFYLYVKRDQAHPESERLYLQVGYDAPCTKTGDVQRWYGRKFYLSEFMTEDEIVKTAYAAFKAAVEHEVMEGFKVDGIVLFNPHVNFNKLLSISHCEVTRAPHLKAD